jgi:hypothetical protein
MTVHIDDSNWQELIEQDAAEGRLAGALPRQSGIGGLSCAPVFADSIPLIPESEWLDRIAYNDANKLWIGDRIQFDATAHSQNGLPYCWAYSLSQAVEAELVRSGLPFQLLAPESLGGDVNWRSQGNMLDSALAYAAKNGIARRQFVPQYEINPKKFDPAWEKDRINFVPLEWWDLDGPDVWAATVTALLSGFGCYIGLDWWSHAVFYDRLVLDGKKIGVHTPNTHGPGNDVNLFDSKARPSLGSFVCRSVTYQPL